MTGIVETDLVLGISPANDLMHVGPASALLHHLSVATAQNLALTSSTSALDEMEYFDIVGRPVSLTEFAQQASSGATADFGRDSGPVKGKDPWAKRRRILLRRINAALDFAQAYLTEHPEAGNQGPNFPVETEVPRPTGSYQSVLAQLSGLFVPLEGLSHRGNWFHNLWHAARG
jgi:hypothetical protein